MGVDQFSVHLVSGPGSRGLLPAPSPLRPVAFRLHLTMGLALSGIRFELPTGR